MNRLRELRKMSGLTQRELGRRVGIEHSRISLAENRLVELSDEEQGKIMRTIAQVFEANANRVRSVLRDETRIAASA